MSGAGQPWRAIARTLVLYNPKDEWRYAIYNDAGIVDGVLLGVSPTVTPEEAQAALLDHVAEQTGHHYSATWKQDEPHWWTAQLVLTTR